MEGSPPVVIDSVRIDGEEVSSRATVEVPAFARRVEISFTAMTLLAPDRLRFRTRLKEIDPTWVDEGTKRTVTYGRLPAGRSTFQVTAVDESELARAKEALEEANRDLDQIASTDRLTGAWNRRQLERALLSETSRSRRRRGVHGPPAGDVAR